MRRAIAVSFVVVTLVAAGSAIGLAQQGGPKGKTVAVTGTLIDTKCYSMDARNKSADHQTPHGEMKGCAALCARLGIPVAVLTEKGAVWTLVTPAQDLVDHMGDTARVTGARVYGGLQLRPDKIEVRDRAGRWTEVKITMPMPM